MTTCSPQSIRAGALLMALLTTACASEGNEPRSGKSATQSSPSVDDVVVEETGPDAKERDGPTESDGSTTPTLPVPSSPQTQPPITSEQISDEDAGRQALDEALEDLGAQPALEYGIDLVEADGKRRGKERWTQRAGTITFTVTSTGLASGRGEFRGERIEIRRIGSALVLRAGQQYWRSIGLDRRSAKSFDGSLALGSAQELGFDPAVDLAPQAVAQRLHDAFDGVGSVERVELEDGSEIFRLNDDNGDVVEVTADEPHRVVETDVPVLTDAEGTGPLLTTENGDIRLGDLSVDDITALRKSLELGSARGELLSLDDPQLTLDVLNKSLECVRVNCVVSGRVSAGIVHANRASEKWYQVSDLRLFVGITVRGGALGTRSCPPVVKALPPSRSSTPVGCSVTLRLPRPSKTPRTYHVVAQIRGNAVATYQLDQKKYLEYLQNEIDVLQAAYDDL